jgi:hypothetical protein
MEVECTCSSISESDFQDVRCTLLRSSNFIAYCDGISTLDFEMVCERGHLSLADESFQEEKR